MSTRKTTQKRKTTLRPPGPKGTHSRYAVRSIGPKPAAHDTQLEFFISLPARADAEAFTDRLIELVEAYKGTVGGGTVAAGK